MLLIEETNCQLQQNTEQPSIHKEEQDLMLRHIKESHTKHEFIVKWFEVFNAQSKISEITFTSESLFDDQYLLKILAAGIPNEFSITEENHQLNEENLSYSQRMVLERKEQATCELKLFTSLKSFYKDRDLDLTEVLKQVRVKKQANKQFDFQTWEKAYWQLIYIVFAAFYIESSQNAFLENYFQIQLRADLKQMKMVLDIITSVMKRCKTLELNSNDYSFQNQSNIFISDQQCPEAVCSQDQVLSQTSLQQQQQDSLYIVQLSDKDYIQKLGTSTGTQEQLDEVEDDLSDEEVMQWDIFDDFNKFQLREQKIKEKRKMQAQREQTQIMNLKAEEVEKEMSRDIEKEIELLERKVRTQEETIQKKNERENDLINRVHTFENKMQMKELEIEGLYNKMVFYETLKHKFDIKKVESETLLTRVEELSQLNGGLEDQIHKQKSKNDKLKQRIDDLRENMEHCKNKIQLPKQLQDQNEFSFYKNPEDVKVKVISHHYRVQSTSSIASSVDQSAKNHEDSLQQELFMDTNLLVQNICLKTRPTMEDEEIFDGTETLRTQYRFDTTEDEMLSQYDLADSTSRNRSFEEPHKKVETELLRSEYKKESDEKVKYRKLYHELQERCYHYQSMMDEYEKLYSEFLGKCIKAEKEKVELSFKLQRVNWCQSGINVVLSYVSCKKLGVHDRRKRTQKGLMIFSTFFALMLIALLILLLF